MDSTRLFAGFAAAALALGTLSSCGKSNSAIQRMQKMEENVGSPTTEAELKEAIKKYQDRIADVQLAAAQVGIWYKMLAVRYLDAKMYGEALKNFQVALQYYPNNQNLFYYQGVCASYVANTKIGVGEGEERAAYLKMAEDSFLRALSIEPNHAKALYSLGVLYVWEFRQCDKAIPILEKLVDSQKKDAKAKAALAAAYFGNMDYDKAVAVYDDIIATTKSPQMKKEAEANRQVVLDSAYAK